jgi:hypothetical protein
MGSTPRPPVLSDADLAAFEADGFVIVREGLSAAGTADLQRWSDEVLAMPEEPGRQWVYHERSLLDVGHDLVSRIENIAPFHAGFARLVEALKAPVAQLLGEPAALFKEKINFKMPGGDGFKPHQDAQAGWDRYASYFITVALCIDEATAENGCIELVAGHHRRGLFESWRPLSEEEMTGMAFKPYPMAAGDMVFFDSYTPHASKANLTDRIRRVYFATYNRASEGDRLAAYYADKRRSYPPDIEREPGKSYVFKV